MDIHDILLSLERRISRLESILMRVPAPDFTKEDALVRAGTSEVKDAQSHLPSDQKQPNERK